MHGLIIALLIVGGLVAIVKISTWILKGHLMDFLMIIFIGGSMTLLSLITYKVFKQNG